MNIKKKLLIISSVLAYIACLCYFIKAGIGFSLTYTSSWDESFKVYMNYFLKENNEFWKYTGLAILSLISGILVSSIKDSLYGDKFTKKQIICLSVYTLLIVVSPLSTVLNLIVLVVPFKGVIKFKEYKKKEHIDYDEDKPLFKKKSFKLAVVSFLAIYLASFIGNLVETNGYKVKVSKFTLTKELSEKYNDPLPNGRSFTIKSEEMKYVVNVYKPKVASESNKLPVIFVNGGYTRSKEAMSHFALELARRGAVVFALDSACHGESTYGNTYINSKGVETKVGTSDGRWGLNYLVSYVYNNTDDYNYVDRDRFGSCGHSQGGAASMLCAYDTSGDTYETSVLKAIQISGYCSELNYYSGLYKCNAMLTWGRLEEGYPGGGYEVYFRNFVNNANGYGVYNYNNIVVDKEYGNIEDGTYRIVTRPNTNHFLTIYDRSNIESVCNFFNKTLKMNSTIDGSKQIWMIKEVTSAISFIAAFSMIVGIAGLLLNTKFFKECKLKHVDDSSDELVLENNLTIKKPKSIYSKIKFFILSIFTALVACFDYYPCCVLGLSLFSETANANYSFYWPCKMFNGVMIWALFNGLLGLIVFFLPKLIETIVYKIKHKNEKIVIKEFQPLKLNIMQILKTILLAFTLFVIFFLNLQIIYWLFHQEYKLLMVICSPINYRAFVAYLIYLPFFIFFYLQNSLRVNLGIGFEGWKEPINKIVAILGNSLGLIFLLFMEYYKYYQTGYVMNSNTTMFNVLYGVTIMMMLLPVLNRAFYKKSNQVLLGALTIMLIFIYISVSSTCNLIPIS